MTEKVNLQDQEGQESAGRRSVLDVKTRITKEGLSVEFNKDTCQITF